MKRVLTSLVPALFLAFITSASTQAAEFAEGINYAIINPPVSTQAEEGKVEVAEVFWYGCPHCYSLEPTIEAYLKQMPENVSFTRVPAMISPNWQYHGTLFYVGRMLDPDGSKGVHSKIFEALQKQRRRIGNDDQLRRFFTGLGFKAEEVNTALKSMELKTQLAYAKDVSIQSGLDSVPTIIVNGKYLTSPSMVSGSSGMLKIIHFLTNLAATEAK